MGKSKTQCRFCLEEDIRKNLISPCSCKGSFKFVHNDCLLKWYTHEPSKALKCSVCLEAFSKTVVRPIEDLDIYKPYMHLILQKPFFSVLICHWVYFSMYSNLNQYNPIRFEISYSIYQIIIHLMSLIYFSSLVSQVKNKNIYIKMWLDRSRIVILPIHLVIFLGILKTTWIGGMASNTCMFLYFYEHIDILSKINEKHNFVFTSRGRGRIEE